MNTYKKYCPNVFVAQCEEKYKKGDIIKVTTKRGKENEHIVHNFVGYTGTKEHPKYCYSITRLDGFNAQERAKRKAEKLNGFASNAEKRSEEAYKKTNLSEEATGIPFGQPILVGHHSEKAHRKVIERADNAMRKSIEEEEKASTYKSRAEYWESKANDINLSMPESIEVYEAQLMEAKEYHKFLKDNPEKRPHSMALQYANKKVKDLTDKVQTAIKLWGESEGVELMEEEKKEDAKNKVSKSKDDLIEKCGGFFAFNNDQFKEGYEKSKKGGFIQEGDKVTHIKAGLYIPSKLAKEFINKY